MGWLEKIWPWLSALAFVMVGLNFVINARDRRRHGPVHPQFEADDVLFLEKGASGASERNWSTRIGGTSNALEVMVIRQGLVIQPNSVIRWMMRRNFNDLEHFIPHENVIILLYLEYSAQFLSVMSRAASGRPA